MAVLHDPQSDLVRHLQAGALTATLRLDAAGNLLAVKLPDHPPEQLDAAALRVMLTELGKYPAKLPAATPFLQGAWRRMQQIPVGSALTYRELAIELGSPKAVRAAGQACAANPLLLVVPCHRIVAEDGLGGFRVGLGWKRRLLELECELAEAG